MLARSVVVASIVVVSGTAYAERSASWVVEGTPDGPQFARQVVPDTVAASGLAKSRTIYLNRVGAMLTPGQNDSQANTSTIVKRATQVPGWNPSAADWAATVSCMREIWSRFDVTITDVDPGATPHIEAIFARSPADVGITENIGGVSPFTTSCSVIEKSIVFAFTDKLPKRPRAICEVMSQEVAHSYGLDHELMASDPMTYLSYSGDREFQDRDVSCGESTARPCGISGSSCRATQNSVQLLISRVGAANRDNTAPTVGITSPAEGAQVDPGFSITATAADNISVKSVAFYIDGDLLATQTQPPYQLTTDTTLEAGPHTITVEATDADGNSTIENRDIVIGGTTDPLALLGCSAGRQPPFALVALVFAVLFARRRRR